MKVTIVGAGNVGLAMAAHLVSRGQSVRLYSERAQELEPIIKNRGIVAKGCLEGAFMPDLVTSAIDEALAQTDLVIVSVPANVHKHYAEGISAASNSSSPVLYHPSVIGSSLEFAHIDKGKGIEKRVIGETVTSVYTARMYGPGMVNVAAIKNSVRIAAYPARETCSFTELLNELFGDRFEAANNCLEIGLSNTNPVYHVAPALMNLSKIHEEPPPQHSLVDDRIADVISAVDSERISLARQFGLSIESLEEFLVRSYGVASGSTRDMIHAAYGAAAFPAPDSFQHRYFTEDIGYGLVPWVSLASAIGLDMAACDALVTLGGIAAESDFRSCGRDLSNYLPVGRFESSDVLATFVG